MIGGKGDKRHILKCPKCNKPTKRYSQKYLNNGTIRYYRECADCGKFTSIGNKFERWLIGDANTIEYKNKLRTYRQLKAFVNLFSSKPLHQALENARIKTGVTND